MTDEELRRTEDLFCSGDSELHLVGLQLLNEVYRLRHELRNPTYMYSATRIPRTAIVWRDEKIKRLQEELASGRKE